MKFSYFPTEEETIRQIRSALVETLQYSAKQPLLLLCSGGSSLKILERCNKYIFWSNITIGVLDERFSQNEQINNFAQLQKTPLFIQAVNHGSSYINTTLKPDDSLQKLTERFENVLKDWREDHPHGLIIAIIGIGEDGHISGVMPFKEDPLTFRNLFESAEWVRGYNAEGKNEYPLRITTTLTFLESEIDMGLVFITGKNKTEAFDKLKAHSLGLNECPSLILYKMKHIVIFTDRR